MTEYARFARLALTGRWNLTVAEADCLVRLAGAFSNGGIGGDTGRTEKTVKNVLLPLGRKMGVPSDDAKHNLRVGLALAFLRSLSPADRDAFLDMTGTFPIPGMGV